MSYEQLTVSCYENAIPPFVESELDRLYGGRYSSLIHFRIYGGLEDINTYVSRANGEVSAIFLFRRQEPNIQVLNEGMMVDGEDIRQFAEYVFAHYSEITTITFQAVEAANAQRLSRPYQRALCAEDTVMSSPGASRAYWESLGKSTRRNITRYTHRLKQSFPSFSFRFYEKEDASEQHIREIINLSRLRLLRKNDVSTLDEEETQRVIAIVKQYGLVCVAMIDEKICGGEIVFRFGQNVAFRVIAHDPQYDDYSLGFLIYFQTICECIDRGAKELNFGWGRYEYKYRLGGVQRDLYRLVVYRSRAHFLLNGKTILQTAAKGKLLETKRRILNAAKREHGVISLLAKKFVSVSRWLLRRRASSLGSTKVLAMAKKK